VGKTSPADESPTRTRAAGALTADPVSAIDNDSALWRAYGIEYWPTQLIFDRKGRLRSTVVGEGEDRSVASTIAALLAER
jgi:hypothetical protein